jgi:hypothetical protein
MIRRSSKHAQTCPVLIKVLAADTIDNRSIFHLSIDPEATRLQHAHADTRTNESRAIAMPAAPEPTSWVSRH